jgi:hypothetical protein
MLINNTSGNLPEVSWGKRLQTCAVGQPRSGHSRSIEFRCNGRVLDRCRTQDLGRTEREATFVSICSGRERLSKQGSAATSETGWNRLGIYASEGLRTDTQ